MNLVLYVLDLCRLARSPADLPYSPSLLSGAILLDLLVSLLALGALGVAAGPAIAVFGTLSYAVMVYGLLYLRSRTARLVQTLTALVLLSLFFNLASFGPIYLIETMPDPERSALGQFAFLLVLLLELWSVVVSGHVLRHAMDLPLSLGIVVSFALSMAQWIVLAPLFGGPVT
jgi:hypothetical protein